MSSERSHDGDPYALLGAGNDDRTDDMAAPIPLFPRDQDEPRPDAGDVLPAPTDPLAVARVLLGELRDGDGLLTMRRWRGEWWRYRGPHWTESETEAIRRWLYLRLEHARYWAPKRDGELELKPWSPDKGKVDKLLDALTAPVLIPRDLAAPSWLSTGESAAGMVPCRNGLVDVASRTLRPATPDYFGTVGVPFDYDPHCAPPAAWLDFLHTLWPVDGDQEAPEVRALQEWFGYVLSGRLDLQKILLVIGPPRSGKGTIARILTDLLGKPNVAAPTLAGLATNFGLQPLLDKSLAIVGDARLQAQGQETVVERLLSISGQDAITVDRKNRDAWTGTVPARLMILSNELPKFGDASGAVASRFVILTLRQSFLGREDIGLGDRLTAELPQILRWALEGLARLDRRRRITEPPASLEAVQELADLVSPISAFLREVCLEDPAATMPFSDLFAQYGEWCSENNRGRRNTAGFSTDIRSRMPHVRTDVRPKRDGRKLPRHVQGLRLNPEWLTRVKDAEIGDRWHGADDWPRREPPPEH